MRTLNYKPVPFPEVVPREAEKLRIAMLSIHSCPIGELGTKDTGGMNVYIRELAREVGSRGHRVDIYTRIHDPKDSQIIELDENVRLIHLKAGDDREIPKLAIYPHLTDFFLALEDFREGEGLQYDLVHSHYWLSGLVGKRAQERWHVPHFVMFHTLGVVKNYTGVGEEEPELRIDTEKQLVKTCDRIIAATEREKEELMGYYDALPETIEVIPCGVNLDLFRPVDKATARQELGLDQEEGIVLYVGRFATLKGIDRLLAAMAYLQQDQGIRLIIIGGDGHDQPEDRELRGLSEELGIQDAVTFAGRIEQEELPPYYSAADLFVLPSYHESFGLVVLESLACGTPVVATKVGAMESIVREGETGYVMPDNAPRSLADKIGAFLLEPQTEVGSAGSIRTSVVKYSWSNIADAMIEGYETMLRDRRA